MAQKGVPVIGSIGYHPEVTEAGLEGRPVRCADAEREIDSGLDQLL